MARQLKSNIPIGIPTLTYKTTHSAGKYWGEEKRTEMLGVLTTFHTFLWPNSKKASWSACFYQTSSSPASPWHQLAASLNSQTPVTLPKTEHIAALAVDLAHSAFQQDAIIITAEERMEESLLLPVQVKPVPPLRKTVCVWQEKGGLGCLCCLVHLQDGCLGRFFIRLLHLRTKWVCLIQQFLARSF